MKKPLFLMLLCALCICLCGCDGISSPASPSDYTRSSHTHYFSDPTCTSPAKCSCGETRGKPLSHTFAPATCLAPKTCTVCNLTEGQALNHTYAPATCLAPKTCTLCSATLGEPLAHTYAPATCLSPQTCTLCSATLGEPLAHTYAPATCQVPQTCTLCSATFGDKTKHQYTAGECLYCRAFSPNYCPKLYFTGDMDNMTSKKDVRNITFEYRGYDQTISGSAKIKVQGTSSLSYDKKNYTINFYEDSDYSAKLGVDVGWGEQTEYCLKANWIDKTHARNIISAQLAAQVQSLYGIMENTPHNGTIDGFPCEVYINGDFHGLYTMNIPKDAWMFGMDEQNPNHIVICGENWEDPVLFKSIPTDLNDWTVEVGEENDQTLQKLQRLVDFVANSTDSEFKENIGLYLDLDSTLNYYVLMKFCYLEDNVAKNMLLVTYDGQIWYPSLYDLDTSWGADWRGTGLYGYKEYIMYAGTNLLWSRVEQLFYREIAQRYFELRQSLLKEDYVMSLFYDFCALIPEEVQSRENQKWGPVSSIPGYPLSQIEEYLEYQLPLLDAFFEKWI